MLCSSPLTYSLLVSILLINTKAQILDQQIPFSLGSNSCRPSWLTLPVPNPTKSFWLNTPNANPLAHEGSSGVLGFGEDEDVDVCVIGSGITGISTVYHLHRLLEAKGDSGEQRKVVVLEAREFCSGATGRNGGHLTPDPFYGYTTRANRYGKDDARKSFLLEDYVASSIVNIIREHELADTVDLVKGDHITLFSTEEEGLLTLQDYMNAKDGGVDLKDVKFLDKQTILETYGVNYPGVFFPAYNLWPLKFVSALFNISSKSTLRLKLHTLTPVTSIRPSANASTSVDTRWTVSTPRGKLTCKNIIHATNGYAPYLLPHLRDRIIPTRGQIIALRANSSLDRLQRRSWAANWKNEYWFPRPEEKNNNDDEYQPPLVILGGGRDTAGPDLEQHTVDDSVLNERVSKTLREFLPDLFDSTGLFEKGREPEMEWTGIMGFTPSEAPLVGPLEGFKGQYIAAGFTGHGMPRAFGAAEAVAGMIVAKLTGTEWEAPEWLPQHYLTTWDRS